MLKSRVKDRNHSHMVFLLLLIMAVSFVCFSCTVEAAKVKLNYRKITMFPGQSKKLTLKGASKKKVKWRSSKSSIVKVDRRGKIKAKKKGNAVITAKYGKKKFICKVKVTGKRKVPAYYKKIEKNNKAVADKLTVKVESFLTYSDQEREVRDKVSLPRDRKTFDTVKITITNHYNKAVKLSNVSMPRDNGQEMIEKECLRGKYFYTYHKWEKPTAPNSYHSSFIFYNASWDIDHNDVAGALIVPAGQTKSITYCMHIPSYKYSKEMQNYYSKTYGSNYIDDSFQFEVIRPSTAITMQVIAYPYNSKDWSKGNGPGMVDYTYSPYNGRMQMNYKN